jgi:hypothetical protein
MMGNQNRALSLTKQKEGEVDIDDLKNLLTYNEATGVFIWRNLTGKSSRGYVGKVAGGVNEHGYVRIKVRNIKYMAHRLAWAFTYGKFPDKELDHINGNRSDNRVANLREVDRSENLQNLRKARCDNALNVLGVYKRGDKFLSQLQVNGCKIHSGRHDTLEDARTAYASAKLKYHIGGYND